MAFALAAATVTSPISVAATVEVADISSLALSPDGRSLAFRVERPDVSRNVVHIDWYVVPTAGGTPVRVADGGHALFNDAGSIVTEAPTWTPTSDAILFRRADRKEIQVWWASATATHPALQVTHDAGDVAAFAIAKDGHTLRYSAGAARSELAIRLEHARESGVRVDHRTDLAIGAVGGGRYLGREAAVRTTGHWFERQPLPISEGGTRSVALPHAPQAVSALPNVSRASTALRLPSEARRRLCKLAICQESRFESWRIGSGGVLVRLSAHDGAQQFWSMSADGQLPVAIAKSPGQLSGDREANTPCAIAIDRIFCVAAEADGPPRLVSVDLAGGGTISVYEPNQGLAPQTRGRAKRIGLTAGGYRTSGILITPYKALSAGPVPLVISYYRCDGFLRGGVGDELPIWPLADAGIAVLCINQVDIVPSAETKLAELSIAAAIVGSAVESLSDDHVIDAARVGMHGLSFGSEATLWVAGHSHLLAAASIASGQTEPSTYWYYATPGRDVAATLERFWGLGDPEQAPGAWKTLAPALYAERISAPVLMQLPEAEARWSTELYAKLVRRCSPTELYVFPGAAHIKSEPRQKEAAYARNLRWFRFWLLGSRNPQSPENSDSGIASMCPGQEGEQSDSKVVAQSSASTSSRIRK